MPVTATGTATGTEAPSATKGFDFGAQKEMFLELLVAQLQNQDPLKPVEDKDFIAQTAQFSQLDQMSKLVSLMEKSVSLQEAAQGKDASPTKSTTV